MNTVQFIFLNLLMIGAGTVLYLVAKTLPRLNEEAPGRKLSLLERWVASEMPHKIDAALNSFVGKFLRKTKVLLLRLDNAVGQRLKKIGADRKEENRARIDFKDITGDKKEE